MHDWIERYARWVISSRWYVITVSVLFCALLIGGAQRITLSNDYRYFFSDENPELVAFEEVNSTYSSVDTLVFVLQSKSGSVLDNETLELAADLASRSWEIPSATRVVGLTNYQHLSADGDDLSVADFIAQPSELTAQELRQVLDEARADPMIADRLISMDARTTAVFVTLSLPPDDVTAVQNSVASARQILTGARSQNSDVRVELSGSAMLTNGLSEAATADLTTLTPLMYLLLAVVMFVLTRSITAVVAAMIIVGLSTFAAMGLVLGWLGVPLSASTAAAPTIILTIAIADSIHVLISILIGMKGGLSKEHAIVESLKVNWQPLWLTSMTTALGFLSLNFSDAPPFRDLGNTTAAGAVIAWMMSVSLLPALLAVLPISSNSFVLRQAHAIDNFANFIIEKRQFILSAMLASVVASIALLPRFEFDDRFVEYFDDSFEFRNATDWAAENLTGIYQIDHSISGRDAGDISDPEYLKGVEAFADWYRSQPEVVHVSAISDVIKQLNKSMNFDDDAFYTLPTNRDEAAQFMLLYELSLPPGHDLNNQVSSSKTSTKMTVTLDNISTAQMTSMRDRANEWQRQNLPEHMYSIGTGQATMFANIGWNNFKAMIWGTLVAMIAISVCLIIALRSAKLGLISLIPNLVPIIVAFGILAIFAPIVGFWSSFVISTSLGVIIDATVHFLSKYRYARREKGSSPEEAVRYAFSNVGAALWVSSLVLIAGFLVLAFSTFLPNAKMGIVVALTIGCAIIVDFLLLPALLILFDREKDGASPQS